MTMGRNRQRFRSRFGGGGAAVAPLISSVQADGWQGVWADGTPPTFDPNGAPVYQTFTRQGFDATGAAITFSEQIPILRRVREPWPNEAIDTASNVALGDYIVSTDSTAGVTNSSTEISPKPIANWVMRDRQLVGDTIDWEIIAFHYYARDNKQVACVRVRGNDGTTQTPWQVVSSTAISGYCEDANPVECYGGTLDISTLADVALGWLEAEVYPHVGADNATYSLSSVLKSEQETGEREFSRRSFYRHVTRAASPPLAYIASTGVNATGVWSTNPATAAASPFLTVSGAMVAMTDAVRGTPATGDYADGCRFRIVDTVNIDGGPGVARGQRVAAMVIERAPGTPRASAIATMNASFRPRLGVGTMLGGLNSAAVAFEDVTVNRTGAFTFLGTTSQGDNYQLHMRNVTFSNSNTASFLSGSHLYTFGVVMTGSFAALGASASVNLNEKRLLRGLTANANGTAPEMFVIVGCNITNNNNVSYVAANETKTFIGYSNKWLSPSASGGAATIASATSGTLLGGIAWVQNLIEATHTTATTAGFRISNDTPAYGSVTHAVVHYNTDTGWSNLNRSNTLYDESPIAKTPPHKFASYVGNLLDQLNNKGDIWAGTVRGFPNRVAAFAFTHGVGCRGTFTQFATANPTTESQTFPGLAAKIGTNNLDRQNPLFTNYEGTGPETGTGGPLAGAGGGTYTLTGPSPARSMVAKPVLAFDLAGSARPTSNDSAGAYT